MTEPANKQNDLNRLYFFVALVLIAGALTAIYSHQIELVSAYKGFGPADYVNQKLFPDNFARDFLGTDLAKHYDRSLVMRSFVLAKSWFGIEPAFFTHIFMFLQCLIFVSALAFLLRALPLSRGAILVGMFPVLLTQSVAGVNMSKYGTGLASSLQTPLFYGWAYAAVFMAVAYSLRDKHIKMGIALGVAALCHISIAVLSIPFIGAWYLMNIGRYRWRPLVIGGAVCLAIVATHSVINIGLTTNTMSTGGISLEEWVKMTRLHCHHWYPFTMGMFTTKTTEVTLLASSLILLLFALRSIRLNNQGFNKILCGIAASVVLVPIGIFFSEMYPVPTLIKLSLQRASAFASFFSIVFYVFYLIGRASLPTDNLTGRLLAVASFSVLLWPGDAVTRLMVLLGLESLGFCLDRYGVRLKLDLVSRIFSWKRTILIAGAFSLSAMFYTAYQAVRDRVPWDRAASYMEAQRWAQEHTESNALFAVDPSHSYAWRDSSARSSFGTFRDWGFVGFAYDANEARYLEGKRRTKLFGLDIDTITEQTLNERAGPLYSKYFSKLRSRYYKMSKGRWKKLAIAEGIDYLVFEKKHLPRKTVKKWPAEFENEHYLIVKATRI